MSHEVETMAYVGAVPWHGLGTKVDDGLTIEQFMYAADIAWNVRKTKLYATKPEHMQRAGQPKAIDTGMWCVQREKDGRVYGACGKSYVPVQNHQAVEFYREFINAGDAKLNTAGSLRDGELVWFLATLEREFNVGPTKDKVESYVLIGVPHKPGKAVLIKKVNMRVVCHNTYTAALGEGGAEYRHPHRTEFTEATIEEAKEVLGMAREMVQLDVQVANALYNKAVSNEDAVRLIAQFMKSEQPNIVGKTFADLVRPGMVSFDRVINSDRIKEMTNRSTRLAIESYFYAPGATPGNAWGVFNGVTHFADHVDGRNQNNRLNSAWFGAMDKVKRDALEELTEMAGVAVS
jgi:phage/plasmid-like protein (TIGR03299 family)